MPLYPVTELDSNQVIKYSFDEATQRLRTDATVNTTITGDVHVEIDHSEDDVLIYGQDTTATHRAIQTNESGNLAVEGVYDVSTNTNPSNVGIITQVRNTTYSDTRQTERPTAKRGVTNNNTVSLDVSLHDHNGDEFTITNPFPSIPSDGTNVITIKAASTAALATDTSEVVALSPNSPLPTGTNNLGSLTNITGTISLPTGASTSTNQTTGNTSLASIDTKVSNLVKLANSGTTTITAISTTEVQITAASGQQSISITNLNTGKVYYSLQTGVSTTNAFLGQNDKLVLDGYAGDIYLIKASGSNDVQIDRFIRT